MARGKFFVDIAEDTASLSLSSTEAAVQLSGGGAAVLAPLSNIPIDGKTVTLTIAGLVNVSGGVSKSVFVGGYIGTSSTLANDTALGTIVSSTFHGIKNFLVSVRFVWDSSSTSLIFAGNKVDSNSASSANINFTAPTGLSQSGINFIVSGQVEAGATASLTITQFSVEL